MGCVDCDCNYLRVFFEMVEENNDGGNGGVCNCVVFGMGEENYFDVRDFFGDVREGFLIMVKEGVYDVNGDDVIELVCIDYEG